MKRLLIDAAHPAELRVLITEDGRVTDFEAETTGKAQLRGNIYIGQVSRVEPSLQAAFITYGGNRNGFLAFGETHPACFKLKPAERTALLEELEQQAQRQRGADEAAAALDTFTPTPPVASQSPDALPDDPAATEELAELKAHTLAAETGTTPKPVRGGGRRRKPEASAEAAAAEPETAKTARAPRPSKRPRRLDATPAEPELQLEATPASAPAPKEKDKEKKYIPVHRRFRIQDVLKEGQKILVQVVKEERGSKGAALTTYLSLPGRYSVLMPNTPSAGGISRKITDPEERKTMREAYAGLNIPASMGLIVRTAGVGRPLKALKHDYTSLKSLYEQINHDFDTHNDVRCLHADGSLIVRALRDMVGDDIDEVIISGKGALKAAQDYARKLMPEAAKKIHEHTADTPIFTHYNVEDQLHQLHHNRVQLPSGGSLVINPTEALVAVDINSGRATQERNIEETALKTNLEAADELARQIRLRDLAGLIVVDFIDMESSANNRKVEAALKKALKRDRARVQTGHISDFGLMEISRQRLRPSFSESHFITCPHCQGSGHIPSPSTAALMVLRRLEHDDCKNADRLTVATATPLVLWLLNHQRDAIQELEQRLGCPITFKADDTLIAPDHILEITKGENTTLVPVQLREQPELPPELRPGYKNFIRPKPIQPASPLEPVTTPEPAEQTPRHSRPRKNAPSAPHAGAGRHPRHDNIAATPMPTPAPLAPPQPKPAPVKAIPQDAPLLVETITLPTDDPHPTFVVAPKKPAITIRRQADTDAPDTPLAVERFDGSTLATPSTAKPDRRRTPRTEKSRFPAPAGNSPAPEPGSRQSQPLAASPNNEPKKPSILARLITRQE